MQPEQVTDTRLQWAAELRQLLVEKGWEVRRMTYDLSCVIPIAYYVAKFRGRNAQHVVTVKIVCIVVGHRVTGFRVRRITQLDGPAFDRAELPEWAFELSPNGVTFREKLPMIFDA